MSNHSLCLVPLHAWAYNSPDREDNGESIDIGLLAEALIYYDSVIVSINNPKYFADLLGWFVQQDKFGDFLALLRDRSIQIYEQSFATVTVSREGTFSLYNIEDTNQKEPNTFERRYLRHPAVLDWLDNSRQSRALINSLRGGVVEVKAAEHGLAIEQARLDQADPDRNAIILQSFVDEIHRLRKLGRPPTIRSEVTHRPESDLQTITWNTNVYKVAQIAKPIRFYPYTTLVAGAISNSLLLSASKLGCDLFVGRPMGTLIGDKLYESNAILKPQMTIDRLKREVEFPDLRKLVNEHILDLNEILEVRDKAQRFRGWLQQEGDRDRNAIIAYHNEVAKEMGFTKTALNLFSLFGAIGGAALDNSIGGLAGAAIGVGVTTGTNYLSAVASQLLGGWKPIVFGDWLKERIEEYAKEA